MPAFKSRHHCMHNHVALEIWQPWTALSYNSILTLPKEMTWLLRSIATGPNKVFLY